MAQSFSENTQPGRKEWRAAVPFALFAVSAVTLSFFNATDISLLTAVGVTAVIIGGLLAGNEGEYWHTIFEYAGSKTSMTAVLLWLMVGVYGSILKAGHIADGLVWATAALNAGAVTFTLAVFLFSALFAVSTGSGFGTISAVSLTLFPAGLAVGGNPALLGGAILSGAALGDSIAPVSDTAVIAAATQEFDDSGRTAEVGESIRHRLPLVLTAALLTAAAFPLAALWLTGERHDEAAAVQASPGGLALLLPTLLIMVLSLRKVGIFTAIAAGTAAAVVTGLTLGLFTPADLVDVSGGSVSGAVVSGIAAMTGMCVLLIVVVAMSGLIIRSRCMDLVIGALDRRMIRSRRSAELTILLLVSVAGILIAAVNTIANICVAPFVNTIGRRHGLHPYRRTTLLATGICTFPFILPYGGCVLLLMKGIEASGCATDIQAADVFLTALYPWILTICVTVTAPPHPFLQGRRSAKRPGEQTTKRKNAYTAK